MVKGRIDVHMYLPDVPYRKKIYVERDFLITIINTIDKKFFKEVLAEVEANK